MINRLLARSLLAFATGLLMSAAVNAQAFRVYLSPTGADVGPCTQAAPCRLLPAALTAVADGGEVWIMGSANYNTGPVALTKSVTILAVPGALASVVALGGNAINISTPGVKVTLRNLLIVPYPGQIASRGIQVTADASLTLQHCIVANLPGDGVVAANRARLVVTDTTIRDNGTNGLQVFAGARVTIIRSTISGNGEAGVLVVGTTPAVATADIAASTISANLDGVVVHSRGQPVKATVSDSQIVGNESDGLLVMSYSEGSATLAASNNIISNNEFGIAAIFRNAKVWASGNTVTHNGDGFSNAAGLLESAGDNIVRSNGRNAVGEISSVPGM